MTLVTNDLPLQTKAAQRAATYTSDQGEAWPQGPTAQINLSSSVLAHSFAVTFLMTLGWL